MSADVVTPPPVSPPAATAAPAAPTPRRSFLRRWLKRLLPLAILLALGVWFAPVIVAKTALRNRLARQALADVRGTVDIGSASLGWFSPVELRDVTITDEAGRVLVRVPNLTTQKQLFDLARDRSDVGEIVLEGPTIAVVCEKNTTNLEAAFAKYLEDTKEPAATRTPLAVRVTGGTLTITDGATGTSASLEGIGATVSVPASRAEPVSVKLTAATGSIDAEVSVGDALAVKLACSGLPLEAFAPLLKRADPDLKLAGLLTANVRATRARDALAVSGTVGVKRLALAAPWLKGDELALDSLELPLDVELAGRAVKVRKFDLTCDAGTLSAAGGFDPARPAEELFAQPGVVLGANVDLAKLAAKLPKLLSVKSGTEVHEGKLVASVASRADGKGVVWDGKLTTTALKAKRAEQVIAWEQPLNVEFAGRYASGQLPAFDKLVVTSDCVAVNARLTPETVQVAANVYLNRLGARLADFVDLGDVKLDGEANAVLVGRRDADGQFAAQASVKLTDFAVTDRAGKGLREPALALTATAAGSWKPGAPVALTAASAKLTANGDDLSVKLLEPVSDVEKLTSGSVELSAGGDLARWKARAAALTKVPPYQISGTLKAGGRVTFAGDRVTVAGLGLDLTNIRFRGAGLAIDEPTMTATGDLVFTRATKTATITKLALTSAPLTVTNGTLAFELKDGVIVSGSGPCVSNLNRLGATVKVYADARGPDAIHGTGRGPLRFRYAGDVTTFAGALDVTDFAYGPKDKPVWSEPALRLEADGSYTDSTDTVALAAAKVDRPGLALDAKGAVAKVTTAQEINLAGTLRYDWAKLAPLLRELAGTNVTATGTGAKPFAVRGTLAPPGAPPTQSTIAALNGELAVGWDSVRAYGFDVGPSELKATMTRGVVTVAPLAATFGGGKVTLAPTLKLDPSPGELILAKGPLIERAKLSPQATAGALGYALPAVANAGQAEGEISATLDECRVPLGDYTRANVKGALTIHRATIGASPVVAEVAKLLGAKATTMTLANEERVPVQVQNGRVYHQNFSVRVSGTTFRTSGSVGFDNTLDLVVDVPLPNDLPLLKNNPLLSRAVAGKVVKVPVKGTLAKPALDPKAFEQAVIALAREGAKDAGRDLIDKELDSLRNSDRWPIHRVMTNYEKLRRKPLLFRMFTGLSADEFDK
ncbi:MAG: hypothetical protein FJ304_26655, partial [Planctomycetes bacterium]|nr:hypothetical protein [Planctomycetota bacterium]